MLGQLVPDDFHQIQIPVLEAHRGDQPFLIHPPGNFLGLMQIQRHGLFYQERQTKIDRAQLGIGMRGRLYADAVSYTHLDVYKRQTEFFPFRPFHRDP